MVGHQYGWLRNGSTAASSARWLPDLSSGWEYRPLVRSWECLEGQECWLSDDGTLRIEALRGQYVVMSCCGHELFSFSDVDKIQSLICDMTSSADVE